MSDENRAPRDAGKGIAERDATAGRDIRESVVVTGDGNVIEIYSKRRPQGIKRYNSLLFVTGGVLTAVLGMLYAIFDGSEARQASGLLAYEKPTDGRVGPTVDGAGTRRGNAVDNRRIREEGGRTIREEQTAPDLSIVGVIVAEKSNHYRVAANIFNPRAESLAISGVKLETFRPLGRAACDRPTPSFHYRVSQEVTLEVATDTAHVFQALVSPMQGPLAGYQYTAPATFDLTTGGCGNSAWAFTIEFDCMFVLESRHTDLLIDIPKVFREIDGDAKRAELYRGVWTIDGDAKRAALYRGISTLHSWRLRLELTTPSGDIIIGTRITGAEREPR